MKTIVESFIGIANAFDVVGALSLFTLDVAIDDASVGDGRNRGVEWRRDNSALF